MPHILPKTTTQVNYSYRPLSNASPTNITQFLSKKYDHVCYHSQWPTNRLTKMRANRPTQWTTSTMRVAHAIPFGIWGYLQNTPTTHTSYTSNHVYNKKNTHQLTTTILPPIPICGKTAQQPLAHSTISSYFWLCPKCIDTQSTLTLKQWYDNAWATNKNTPLSPLSSHPPMQSIPPMHYHKLHPPPFHVPNHQ